MFNAGQGNQMNQFNAGSANTMIQNQLNRNMGMDQFNQNMDFNVWNQNNQNMRNGTQDQIGLLNTLLGWQGLGVNAANNVQNTPLNYWQQFAQGAGNLGGVGGTIDQTGTDSKNYQAIRSWVGSAAINFGTLFSVGASNGIRTTTHS